MIVFRYTKTDGAEYISHLDMLRHLNKIIRRAGINANYSKGFNPHMSIFMSAPIAVGVKSLSEYCLVDCEAEEHLFIQKFNEHTFNGVICLNAFSVNKKVNVQGAINRAIYSLSGISPFDVNQVLNAEKFEITDKKGNKKDVRHKIFNLFFEGDLLIAELGFGNDTLRPDYLTNELVSRYGGCNVGIVKTNMLVDEVTFDDYVKQFKN